MKKLKPYRKSRAQITLHLAPSITSRPQKAGSRQFAKTTATQSAHRLSVRAVAMEQLADQPPPKYSRVDEAIYAYCSLWFHACCGGTARSQCARSISCDGCDYVVVPGSSEPLGLALQRSEFQPKIYHQPWFS